MSSQAKLIKGANSKGKLVKAIIYYQRALQHYANESHWAVRGEDIVWIGDDDPTYVAQLTLGQRKVDPKYVERNRPVPGQKEESSDANNTQTAPMPQPVPGQDLREGHQGDESREGQ